MGKPPAKSALEYAELLSQVKVRIRQAQTRAILSANTEMIRLYRDIGRLIHLKQLSKGWALRSFQNWQRTFAMNYRR